LLREKAADAYRRATDIDPNDASSADALASSNIRLKNLPAAIKIWNDLLHRLPAYGPAHAHLGEALRTAGNTDGAIAELRQAVLSGDRDPRLEIDLARLVASDPRQPSDAALPMIALVNDACDQTRGHDPEALDALAICLARVGRFDDAVATSRTAAQLAHRTNNPDLAKQIELRLATYQKAQPWFSAPNNP
jgi:tetratricopeptide (TPR) repeat protein